MSHEWTYVITAPAGEAVELRHLRPFMRQWRRAKKRDEDGREWEVDGELPVSLRYAGPSTRRDLVDRIICVLSTRNSEKARELCMSFVDKVSSELGWTYADPFDPEAGDGPDDELDEPDDEPAAVPAAAQQPVRADTARAQLEVKRLCAEGQWEPALEVALSAWRKAPATELAKAIDRLGWRALEEQPDQPGWSAAKTFAQSKTPHTLTGALAMNLLHELPKAERTGEPSWERLLARIALLRQRGPDPRTAAALCQAVMKYGPRVEASDPVAGPRRADAMLEALAEQGDPEQAAVYARWCSGATSQRFRAAARRLARPPVVTERGWEKLQPGRLPAFGPAFASRKVVADALLAQSNPLGEAIATHSGGAPLDKKQARLLRVLLGPLHRVLTAVRWRDGFPSKGRLVEVAGVDWEALALDDRLGTFEELDPGKCGAAIWVRFLRTPAARSLARAIARESVELEALLARDPPIAEVVLAMRPTVELLQKLRSPRLELPWSSGLELGPLLGAMQGRVEALTWKCPAGWQTPADVVAELLEKGRGFGQLTVDLGDTRFVLAGAAATVAFTDDGSRLQQMARGLPKLETLTFVTPEAFDAGQLGWARPLAADVRIGAASPLSP